MAIPIIVQAPINPEAAVVDANRDAPDVTFELRHISYIFCSYALHFSRNQYVSMFALGACAYFATRLVTYIGRDSSFIQALEQATLSFITELPFVSLALCIAMFAALYFTSIPYTPFACGIVTGLSAVI